MNAFDLMDFDALGERAAAEPHDPDREVRQRRLPRFASHRQPHLEGRLGCQPVKLEGRQQADHSVRDLRRRHGESVMLRRREVRPSVDATPEPEQRPLLDESADGDPGRPPGLEIPRTNERPWCAYIRRRGG